MTAREVLLAWAKSPGFAAIHNGAATDEQIVDDLLKWLDRNGIDMVKNPDRRVSEYSVAVDQSAWTGMLYNVGDGPIDGEVYRGDGPAGYPMTNARKFIGDISGKIVHISKLWRIPK